MTGVQTCALPISPMFIGLVLLLFICIILVFAPFILSPSPAAVVSSSWDFSRICWWLCESSAMSSAKSRSSSCSVRLHWMPVFLLWVVCSWSSQCTRVKGKGKQAALFHPGEHCECFLCLSLVEHLALHVLVCVLDDVYVFGGDSVVCHSIP